MKSKCRWHTKVQESVLHNLQLSRQSLWEHSSALPRGTVDSWPLAHNCGITEGIPTNFSCTYHHNFFLCGPPLIPVSGGNVVECRCQLRSIVEGVQLLKFLIMLLFWILTPHALSATKLFLWCVSVLQHIFLLIGFMVGALQGIMLSGVEKRVGALHVWSWLCASSKHS